MYIALYIPLLCCKVLDLLCVIEIKFSCITMQMLLYTPLDMPLSLSLSLYFNICLWNWTIIGCGWVHLMLLGVTAESLILQSELKSLVFVLSKLNQH